MAKRRRGDRRAIGVSQANDEDSVLSELTKEELRRELSPLVKKFVAALPRISELSEEDIKIGYVLPMLKLLGWDAEGVKQVRAEVRTLSGRTDLALLTAPDRRPSLFVEVKPARESLDGKTRVGILERTFPEQAINDAWQMRIDFAVLTNFEETRLYQTHVRNPSDGLIFVVKHHLMLNDDELANLLTLARWNVLRGSLEQLEVRRTRKDVNAEILEDLFRIRQALADSVVASNSGVSLDELRTGVQRIIDRLIVIRTAEDRGVIPSETIAHLYDTWRHIGIAPGQRTFFKELSRYFRDFDEIYNSAIFSPHPLEKWAIDNSVWNDIVRILYSYNFDKISADVLGSVYEDYIGHVLQEARTGQLVRVEDVTIQQEGGIYYTPTYIVDYIVWVTLGGRLEDDLEEARKLIESGRVSEAKELVDRVKTLKVLDPSCGSGSFLIKCFDYFADFYSQYNRMLMKRNRPAELIHLFESFEEHILTKQLFGVDLDEQACEIAGVNLVLKALKTNKRLPLILDRTVITANSLLFGDEKKLEDSVGPDWRKFKPVQWDETFSDAMSDGGFDFVVGNPPWGARIDRSAYVEQVFVECAKGQYDIWDLFVELSKFILKPQGRWGFVLPATFFYREHEPVRRYLLENMVIDTVVQCGEKFFPNINMATCLLVFEKKQNAKKRHGTGPVLGIVLTKEDRTKVLAYSDSAMMRELEETKGNPLEQSWFENDDHAEFQLLYDEDARSLKSKIEMNTVPWEDFTNSGRGVELSADGQVMQCPSCRRWDSLPARERGGKFKTKKCIQCGAKYTIDQSLNRDRIILDLRGNAGKWKPFLAGEDINRYYARQHLFIEVTHDGINYKGPVVYSGEKLLVRKTGLGIMASITRDDVYFPQVVFYWKKKPNLEDDLAKYSLEYLLALISSRLLLWWFYHKTGITEWISFPYVSQQVIQQFPIRKIDWNNLEQVKLHDQIKELVNRALADNRPIDIGLDWEIEDCIMKLYGISNQEKVAIHDYFKSVHRMRIVRELYPQIADES